MKLLTYSAIFVAIILNVVGQFASPCPGIFAYQNDGGQIYGMLHLEPTKNQHRTLEIRLNYTVAAYVSGYLGLIKPAGDIAPGLLLKHYNHGIPLNFRVHFPITSPLPHITSITVNERIVCYGPGDTPEPNKYISTVTLESMLYLEGPAGSDPGFFENPPGSSGPVDYVIGSIGDNTLTTISLDNKGTWTSIIYPGDLQGNNPGNVYDTSRPVLPTHPRPQRPPVQYPGLATEATRPQTPPPVPQTNPTTQRPVVRPYPSTPTRTPDFSSQIECGVIEGGNERIPLIYQGFTYPRGDLPWLVAIYKREKGSLTFICAGTLVSDRHVVTAAHCMHQRSQLSTIKDMVVKIGVYNLEDWGDDISVTRTLQAAAIHESYNATTLENDILVFTLERAVEFNTYIRPACLWSGNTDLRRIVGATGVVAGWGANEVGPRGQGDPRMVRIPIVSTAQCRASKPEFHRLTSERTLCAGDRKGAGPCLGDSGGGLYILDNGRWRLRGVISLSLRPTNGANTCNLDEYVVFTDTAQYLSWIKKILSQNYFDS